MMLSCLLVGVLLSFFRIFLCLPFKILADELHPLAKSIGKRMARPPSLTYLRNRNRHGKYKRFQWISVSLQIVSDIVTVILGAIMLLLILYVTNNGLFRASAPVLLVVGYFSSHITLARIFTLIIHFAFVFCKAIIEWMLALAVFPFYRTARYLWRKSKPLRVRCKDRLEKRKLAHALRAADKKHRRIRTTDPVVQRPQHDGKHVYCVGRSTIIRNIK